MKKFIPYEKLSKKERRKIDAAKRSTWGELSPVTRKAENCKAYQRNKSRNRNRDLYEPISGFFMRSNGEVRMIRRKNQIMGAEREGLFSFFEILIDSIFPRGGEGGTATEGGNGLAQDIVV